VNGVLLAHAPGWNTALVRRFAQGLPTSLRWFHFGDLDPEGLEVASTLARDGRCLLWIPRCWKNAVEAYGLPLRRPWPVLVENADTHPPVKELVKKRQWLEQEVIVLEPALRDELLQLVLVGHA